MIKRSPQRLKTLLEQGKGSDRWTHQHNHQFTTRIGFYRAQVIDQRWWLVGPDNQPCLSLGVNHIVYDPSPSHENPAGRNAYAEAVRRRYGSEQAWAQFQARRMRRWHFNTVGAWSSPALFDQGLAYTLNLEISSAAAGDVWLHGDFPDVFSPAFEQAAAAMARERCLPRQDDPHLLGYFTDNELDWEGWRRLTSLLEYFLAGPPATPARQALAAHLKARYGGDAVTFNAHWDTRLASLDDLLTCAGLQPGPAAVAEKVKQDQDEFLRLAARTYFETCHRAIRSVDPNHMILGVRFAGTAHPIVVEECADFVDVLSYNHYGHDVPRQALDAIFALTWKPVLITEWSFKAMDSGLPNTKGGGIPVSTQEDRADGYERYVTQALALPYVVGLHWFMWCDEPALGRIPDGENSNYGVVDEDDEPYLTLVERMRVVNREAVALAKRAGPLLGG